MDWMCDADCRGYDPDVFFNKQREAEALDLCGSCAVKGQCADYAVKVDSPGIWGGLTERDRRGIRQILALNPVPILWS